MVADGSGVWSKWVGVALGDNADPPSPSGLKGESGEGRASRKGVKEGKGEERTFGEEVEGDLAGVGEIEGGAYRGLGQRN
jgi:hypothetical protein